VNRRTTVALAVAGSLAVVGVMVQTVTGHAEGASTGSSAAGSAGSAGPSIGTRFYVDPDSGPATWVAANSDDGRTATIRSAIARRPLARWYGSWSGAVRPAVRSYVKAAAAKDRMPVLVAYNIPDRDACGQESAGGAKVRAYRTWIRNFAVGIGKRPAMVVLEPDALADLNCLTGSAATTRRKLLSYAVTQLADRAPNAYVYLDAGNPGYASAATTAKRLKAVGVAKIRGFSLNVSNFYTTGQEKAYAARINKALRARGVSTRRYVVDTSRNGNGSNGSWCNPAGRRIGTTARVVRKPTAKKPEALLWVKTPGESDGSCGTAAGSTAGDFDPQLAYDLVKGN